MKLKDIPKEELEAMSYGELAEAILTDKGNSMKIVDVFKQVCKILNMSDAQFEQKITDFFELISTDKNFIVLDKGFCDLRKKHTPELVVIEDDEDDVSDTESSEDVIEDDVNAETEDDIYYDNSSDEDDVDDSDDELNDFLVVDDEDETSM